MKDPPFNAHGQKVFTDGVRYLTKDVDAHSGGVWKIFDRFGNRQTVDEFLQVIGP